MSRWSRAFLLAVLLTSGKGAPNRAQSNTTGHDYIRSATHLPRTAGPSRKYPVCSKASACDKVRKRVGQWGEPIAVLVLECGRLLRSKRSDKVKTLIPFISESRCIICSIVKHSCRINKARSQQYTQANTEPALNAQHRLQVSSTAFSSGISSSTYGTVAINLRVYSRSRASRRMRFSA